MIPDQDTMLIDMTIDQDLIDSNPLVEDKKNWADVIDCKHNQDPHILPLSDALAANAKLVTRIRRH